MSNRPQQRTWDAMNALAARITERDRLICNTLYAHRVLTTDQLRELHFDSDERARKRLAQLHALQVLDRFRPRRQLGSSPYHYVLAQLGAYLVAADRGIDPARLDWSDAHSLRLASSQQLTHLIEASGFFTHLAHAARTTGAGQLLVWWGQHRCGQAWGEVVRPDGYARLRLDHHDLEVWAEWDRGTEQRSRLQNKLDRYHDLALGLHRPITLLLALPSDRREHEVRGNLQAVSDVQALTSTAARHNTDPLARNWLATGSEHRVSLSEVGVANRPSSFSRQDPDLGLADPQNGSSAGPTSTEHTCPQEHEYD